MDKLFDDVKANVKTLLVYLTRDILTRPWCAGEVTVASQTNRVRVLPVVTPSFIGVSAENLADLSKYIDSSGCRLEAYGISYEQVASAIRLEILNQNLNSCVILDNSCVGLERFEKIVQRIVHSGRVSTRISTLVGGITRNVSGAGMTRNVSDTVGKAAGSDGEPSIQKEPSSKEPPISPQASKAKLKTGGMVISSDPNDDEAIAATGILYHKIREPFDRICVQGISCLCNFGEGEAREMLERGNVVMDSLVLLVVLSKHTLHVSEQLLSIVVGEETTGLSPIPVVLAAFTFPLAEYWDKSFHSFWKYSDSKGAEEKCREFFKHIATPLSIAASEDVLAAQVFDILSRIPKSGKSNVDLSKVAVQNRLNDYSDVKQTKVGAPDTAKELEWY